MFPKSFFLYIGVLIQFIAPGKGAARTYPRLADIECQKIVDSIKLPLEAHIIGGEEAVLGEFPHMVALGYRYKDLLGYNFDCGGSLVSDRYVLTAAHCVEGVQPNIVRMGLTTLGGPSFNADSDVFIERIHKHPNYTPAKYYDDLALLELEEPIQFNDNLNPACLYTEDSDPNTPLTVTGWGITDLTKEAKSNILLKTNVTVAPREFCNASYPITIWRKLPQGISPSQICAGDPEAKRDACKGDSGGPLQSLSEDDGHTRVVGVTSFGRGCGSPTPAVYTRVTAYLDWIESVVWP